MIEGLWFVVSYSIDYYDMLANYKYIYEFENHAKSYPLAGVMSG